MGEAKLICIILTLKLYLNMQQTNGSISFKPNNDDFGIKSNWVIQMGVLTIAQVAEPALAVTGVNNEEDLIWVLLKAAVVAF
ncbi:NAD(P)H-quinone oxidoreductase subunit L chloroplastic, partial [Bienertia sinuspersici]